MSTDGNWIGEWSDVKRVSVTLKDPSYFDNEGHFKVDTDALKWTQVPWSDSPVTCLPVHPDDPRVFEEERHIETICPHCIESWSIDSWLRIYGEDDQLFFDSQAETLQLPSDS